MTVFGRSPHGECGLKFCSNSLQNSLGGRSPHGECGLKSEILTSIAQFVASLPAWGVWIEIAVPTSVGLPSTVAPRMGSVD